MKPLQQHEQFEMAILDIMRRVKILEHLAFGGGTMLRLCFDLPRYSIDFDFYLTKTRRQFLPWATRLTTVLKVAGLEITDHHAKHYSFLWEVRSRDFPQRLKIEVRKDLGQSRETELNIAHSPFSSVQVRLRTLTLRQMFQNKVAALIAWRAIRDAYDLEFLVRRDAGNFATLEHSVLAQLHQSITRFTKQEFQVTLGAVLDPEERARVCSSQFSYVRAKIAAAMS